jgi:hypothetical protein
VCQNKVLLALLFIAFRVSGDIEPTDTRLRGRESRSMSSRKSSPEDLASWRGIGVARGLPRLASFKDKKGYKSGTHAIACVYPPALDWKRPQELRVIGD